MNSITATTSAKPGIDAYLQTLIRLKARWLVGKADIAAQDVEDIEGDLTAHLLQALGKFDAARATWHTFAARVVGRHAVTIVRSRLCAMRRAGAEDPSLHETVPGEDGQPVARAEETGDDVRDILPGRWGRSAEEARDLAIDVNAAVAALPDDLRTIAELLKTQSILEVAQILDLSRTSVYRAVEKIRERFEAAGLRAYL